MNHKIALLIMIFFVTNACSGLYDKISNVGQPPAVSKIENPVKRADYRPISMPMPPKWEEKRQPNSLWRSGAKTFFKDQRARQVGDIVTITVNISDNASFDATSTRSRNNTENAGIDNLLGIEGSLNKVLPEAVDAGSLVGMTNTTNNSGTGSTDRTETISLKVSAVITQILPNGNMVVHGRQETRLNYEIRELQISGIIRPGDITSTNTINYEQIAEARLSYGGRGHISDFQQPRYGSQVLDVVLPF